MSQQNNTTSICITLRTQGKESEQLLCHNWKCQWQREPCSSDRQTTGEEDFGARFRVILGLPIQYVRVSKIPHMTPTKRMLNVTASSSPSPVTGNSFAS